MTTKRQHRRARVTTYENCIVCGKRKETPKVMQKGMTRAEYEADAYCSRTCCESAHGIEDPRSPLYSGSGMLGRQGPKKKVA